jgi:hypothetical protein
LSLEELERRYRQAKEAIERSHYQIIWLWERNKKVAAAVFFRNQLVIANSVG